MGLDMYLEARLYTSDRSEPDINKAIKKILPDIPISDNLGYISVNIEVAYWRKANQIHKWFVDNVQGGNDDCSNYYVEPEQLRALLNICNQILANTKLIEGAVVESYSLSPKGEKIPTLAKGKVIENPEVAEKLLPPQSGFFFGGTEYDQWYHEDIVNTKKQLEQILNNPNIEKFDLYYHSSW